MRSESWASLRVRNVDEALVQRVRERAAAHGRSVEAEYRAILAKALRTPKRKTFAEALMSIPNVGEHADFARVEDCEAANGSGCQQRIGEI
ncbi:DNA-binding protein [Burkholderia multivorans]|uniref:FitA-like ribbon-helix-helix domain-containing protein n=1 Tax=Burkholderia TaxID=32008 RepID=UPI0005BBA75B|nr:DNA-binding protein [Burkholderia multivorans]MBJ9654194.1 DNA-binding protein [Burkholderia multivorans]MBR8046802.1 DNA-binding protein [Burkholderia multivorans]MBR8122711.1 DNA-binding protein [Burkholderia multivorans]MBR8338665.1 DNA-binding protein [Burkholderia multivorans]MBU9161227.1 DNA-binding protein [Burkholderia multivorans]